MSLSYSTGLWTAPEIDLAACTIPIGPGCGAVEIRSLVAQHVLAGRGFVVLKATPLPTPDEACHWLLRTAAAIGETKPQNAAGEHVLALTDSPEKQDWLEEQPFHTDAGDLLLLYCVQPALHGGRTRLANAASAYAKLAEDSPHSAQLLLEPWQFDRKGRPGPPTFERRIIDRPDGGPLSCFHLPGTARLTLQGQADHETSRRLEALAAFDRALEDPENNISILLAPGDCLIVNNSRVLHARTSYTDGSKPRLLFRCWVDIPSQRQ